MKILAVWVFIAVSIWRNYARNDNCSPCRRKISPVLKYNTKKLISVLQLRMCEESSIVRQQRKGLMVIHKGCVHCFANEKGGNVPKRAASFSPFVLRSLCGEPDDMSAQILRDCRCFALQVPPAVHLCPLWAAGCRVLIPKKAVPCFMNLHTICFDVLWSCPVHLVQMWLRVAEDGKSKTNIVIK